MVYKAAHELIDFFDRVAAEDWPGVETHREKIVGYENEADDLKKTIRSQIKTGVFMPVSREDLLELVVLQDKIANVARDISGIVFGRQMKIPAQIKEPMLTYVRRNIDAAKKARSTMRELDELYETGFKGKEAELVESLVAELDEIENDTDRQQIEIRKMLMEIEETLPPIKVLFLYRVIDLVGDIADRAEVVGRRLEVLLNR